MTADHAVGIRPKPRGQSQDQAQPQLPTITIAETP
jgi:hypothetical protein